MTVCRLTGMTWDHPRGYRCLEAASVAYAAVNDVEIVWDRRSLQAFADAPIADLAQRYDLIVLDHPHVGLIAESACLVPLRMPADQAAVSLGGSLESYMWQGELWAYPIDAACQVAVKRSDLCPTEPGSWEELLDGDVDLPIATPLLPVDAFDMMMTLIAGRGEERLPHSNRAFCSDANGLLSLNVLKRLYRRGPAEAVDWNPIKVLEALSTTDEFAYSPCLFGYINYARPGFRSHVLDYCDLPSFRGSDRKRGILGGTGLGVSARGNHQDAARAFAEWVSGEPVQSGVYLDNEGQPGHRQTWLNKRDDPRYARFLKGAYRTMENAWTRPRDGWFLGFVDDVCAIFPDFFKRDRDEAKFLAEINALYRKHRENWT